MDPPGFHAWEAAWTLLGTCLRGSLARETQILAPNLGSKIRSRLLSNCSSDLTSKIRSRLLSNCSSRLRSQEETKEEETEKEFEKLPRPFPRRRSPHSKSFKISQHYKGCSTMVLGYICCRVIQLTMSNKSRQL